MYIPPSDVQGATRHLPIVFGTQPSHVVKGPFPSNGSRLTGGGDHDVLLDCDPEVNLTGLLEAVGSVSQVSRTSGHLLYVRTCVSSSVHRRALSPVLKWDSYIVGSSNAAGWKI